MSTALIQQLDATTRATLKSVGILEDIQLAEIHPNTLIRDLEQYYDFFPDRAQVGLIDLVPRLCGKAQELLKMQGIAFTPADDETVKKVASPLLEEIELSQPVSIPVPAPTPLSDESFSVAKVKKHERDIYKQGIGNAIRYKRSFTCYLGAFCTWIIFPLMLSALLLPVYMLFDKSIPINTAKNYIGGVMILGFLYYICSGLFRCQVCHINIYSVRKFPRHRHAHRFLFLNTSLPTAFAVLTKMWFRCPACGTAQKLFRKKRDKKSSRK